MNNLKEVKQNFLNDMIDFLKQMVDIDTEEDEEECDKKIDRFEERYDEIKKNIKSFV